MAHLITESDDLVYVGEVPWHGIGKEVDPDLNAHEVMMQAGLDWQVKHQAIYTLADGPWGIQYSTIPGAIALVRSDNGAVLGLATDKYKGFQNQDGFDVFQRILDTGMAKIEVAGSLKGGKVVWALARIQVEAMVVHGNDTIDSFALLSFGHDGQSGIRAGFTPIRTVCQNTITAAYNDERSKLVRVVHRGNVKQNVQALIDAMDLSVQEFRVTVGEYRKMLNTSINQKDLREYVRVTLGVVESPENKRATNLVDKVAGLAYLGKGNVAVAGTVWAAYNGVTEYLTHQASRNVDNRFHSLWFGNNKQVLQRAYDEAVRLVA